MKAWLFTWNPNNWAWDTSFDGYNELRKEIAQLGFTIEKWSCGVNKSIQKGDRIFLIRLGTAERGIVASGYAETGVFEGTHWNLQKAKDGIPARRVYVRFDKILDIDAGECLPYETLLKINEKYHWSPQSSGVSIPEDTARFLDEYWNHTF